MSSRVENKADLSGSIVFFYEPIIQALSSPSSFIREEAAFTLRMSRGAKVVEALITALKDESAKVRRKAAYSLGFQSEEPDLKIAKALIPALKDTDREVCAQAAISLGRINVKQALPVLIKLLWSNDPKIRLYSAMAVGRMKNSDGASTLLKRLKIETDVKVRATIFTALGSLGSEEAYKLFIDQGINDRDSRIRATAVESLAAFQQHREEIIKKVTPLIKDLNNRVKANASLTLWKLGDFQAFDHISRILKQADKWEIASIVYVLGEIRNSEAVCILENYQSYPEVDVRLNVARAFGRIGSPRTVGRLMEMLLDDESVVSEAAYFSLFSSDDFKTASCSRPFLKSKIPEQRLAAARMLAIGDSQFAECLVTAYISEKIPEIKQAIWETLTIVIQKFPLKYLPQLFQTMPKEHQVSLLKSIETVWEQGEMENKLKLLDKIANESRYNAIRESATRVIQTTLKKL